MFIGVLFLRLVTHQTAASAVFYYFPGDNLCNHIYCPYMIRARIRASCAASPACGDAVLNGSMKAGGI